ncbi:aminotransferase class III-fold pyridoxal phosphate-dependent enzyme, partial [bacterium]|nr:aminotransferase class III-fold pyridoxal phosphate-dependent enzyme [bacterium]
PDIMTMAKGIAAGVACGAIIAKDEVAPSLRPGMHASTFGGNPIAMVAGKATVETIEEENLLENCKQISARFKEFFDGLKEELSIIEEVRVCGAMIGVDLGINAMPAVKKAMERGLLLNATHDTVVRLLPALNITDADVTHGCEIIAEVLKEMADEASGA